MFDLLCEIEYFRTPEDYNSFVKQLENSDDFEKYDKETLEDLIDFKKYHLFNCVVHGFRHKETNQLWYLVEPDPPARGSWKKVI